MGTGTSFARVGEQCRTSLLGRTGGVFTGIVRAVYTYQGDLIRCTVGAPADGTATCPKNMPSCVVLCLDPTHGFRGGDQTVHGRTDSCAADVRLISMVEEARGYSIAIRHSIATVYLREGCDHDTGQQYIALQGLRSLLATLLCAIFKFRLIVCEERSITTQSR